MHCASIARNVTVLSLEDGTQMLFSYQTPVAAFVPGQGYLRTEQYYSVTTNTHIGKWLQGAKATRVPQHTIDAFLTR